MRLSGPHSPYGHCWEKNNFFHLPGIEPQFLGYPASCPLLYRLCYTAKNIFMKHSIVLLLPLSQIQTFSSALFGGQREKEYFLWMNNYICQYESHGFLARTVLVSLTVSHSGHRTNKALRSQVEASSCPISPPPPTSILPLEAELLRIMKISCSMLCSGAVSHIAVSGDA
jgi:hypothetical protein